MNTGIFIFLGLIWAATIIALAIHNRNKKD